MQDGHFVAHLLEAGNVPEERESERTTGIARRKVSIKKV
jgi:hypothetical protein